MRKQIKILHIILNVIDMQFLIKNVCVFFRATGDKRRFFINKSYDGCKSDIGWLLVLDKDARRSCEWEKHKELGPLVLYSPSHVASTYNKCEYSCYTKTQ